MTIPTDDRLSTGQILSYSLPMFSLFGVFMTINIYIPNFYTDELGVSASLVSWVFLCGRVWDAVTDPAMGHLSDRTRSRWGRRRPYFLLSILPLWLFSFLIWWPSSSLSTTGTFMHLMICYLGFFTFYTVFYIPYYSLGMEMTPDYHERSRLFGVRQTFGFLGNALGIFAPVIFLKAFGSKVAGYPWMGAVFGMVCAVFFLIMFFRIKERPELSEKPKFPFFKGVRVSFQNRAFVILMLVYMICLMGQSLIGPLALYVAKYVVKVEWVVQPLIFTYMGCGLLSIPIWLFLSKRIGKNKTWSISLLIGAAGYFGVFTISEGTWLRWILCTIPTGAAAGCTMVLGSSILADVIDSDELETGTRREGAFIGVIALIDKAAIGLAIFIGLQVLGWIGYVPNVEQTKIVITGILILCAIVPACLNIVGLLLFQMFPITKEVHDEIRMKLEARRKDNVAVETV